MDKSKYVVLDVETNGLSSLKHDLLSISIYKPDDEKFYDRFLPLELNDFVETYWINGIDEELLADKEPLTQEEFDQIIFDFELESRTILTFGSIDEKFTLCFTFWGLCDIIYMSRMNLERNIFDWLVNLNSFSTNEIVASQSKIFF